MPPQPTHLMMCEAMGTLVEVCTAPGRSPDKARVLACLSRTDLCYQHDCAFTTDGCEVPVVELQPFVTEGI